VRRSPAPVGQDIGRSRPAGYTWSEN